MPNRSSTGILTRHDPNLVLAAVETFNGGYLSHYTKTVFAGGIKVYSVDSSNPLEEIPPMIIGVRSDQIRTFQPVCGIYTKDVRIYAPNDLHTYAYIISPDGDMERILEIFDPQGNQFPLPDQIAVAQLQRYDIEVIGFYPGCKARIATNTKRLVFLVTQLEGYKEAAEVR